MALTRRLFLERLTGTAGAAMTYEAMAAIGLLPVPASAAPFELRGRGNGASVVVLGGGLVRHGDRLRAGQTRLQLPRARSAHASRRTLPHRSGAARRARKTDRRRSRPLTRGCTTTPARCASRITTRSRSAIAASWACRWKCSSTRTRRPTSTRPRARRSAARSCVSAKSAPTWAATRRSCSARRLRCTRSTSR